MFIDDMNPTGGLPGIHFVSREPTIEDLNRYVHRLLRADWDSPGSALQLARDLTPEQAGSTLFLDQARIFLRLIVESNGVELTPNGWLKLAVVARMIERMEWLRRELEPMRRFIKRIGEQDVRPLGAIRDVCEAAAFVRPRRNRIYVPRRVHPLLADEQAGRLYRLLFLALFRRLSPGFCYGSDDEAPLLKQTMAVTLWRLHIVARDWIALRRLPEETLLDRVLEEAEASSKFPELTLSLFRHRVLEPLEWFGLLERDRKPDRIGMLDPETRFRKTPLFDRFIRFPPFPIEPPVEAS